MTKYELVMWWSEGDQAFLVEVPELPGCMADGATQEEALTNVQTVIREWIETARETLGATSLSRVDDCSTPEVTPTRIRGRS